MIQLIGYAGMLVGCGAGLIVRHRQAGICVTILSGVAMGLAAELVLIFLTGVQLE